MFAPLAEALAPQWRVIALDQRGHGESERAQSYQRADYVADIAAFHRHLGLGPVLVLGHSLGGVNAYQYAARHAGQVTALIVEDVGAVVNADWSLATRLPRQVPSRQALASALGSMSPYLECSFQPGTSCIATLQTSSPPRCVPSCLNCPRAHDTCPPISARCSTKWGWRPQAGQPTPGPHQQWSRPAGPGGRRGFRRYSPSRLGVSRQANMGVLRRGHVRGGGPVDAQGGIFGPVSYSRARRR